MTTIAQARRKERDRELHAQFESWVETVRRGRAWNYCNLHQGLFKVTRVAHEALILSCGCRKRAATFEAKEATQ